MNAEHEICERAKQLAAKTGVDWRYWAEVLAIGSGLSTGCVMHVDERGREIRRKPRWREAVERFGAPPRLERRLRTRSPRLRSSGDENSRSGRRPRARYLKVMSENEGLLRTRDVARLLSLCPETVRRHAAAGRIRALRLPSGEYRFPTSDLTEYAEPKFSAVAA